MYFISKRITSIRNAKNAKLKHVSWIINQKGSYTSINSILTILRNSGYIRAFTYKSINVGTKTYKEFIIYLKYDETGSSVIRSISNISKPSRKIYVATQSLWQPQSTSGVYILSTPLGIITDTEARRHNVGGCLLFSLS